MTDTLRKVFDIWYNSSTTTQPLRGIQLKCDRYIVHVNTLRKHCNENRIHSDFEKYDILFDIASCKYKNIKICRCQSLFKAPINKRENTLLNKDLIELTTLEKRTPTPFQSRRLTSPSNEPSTSTCKLVTNNFNHLFILN